MERINGDYTLDVTGKSGNSIVVEYAIGRDKDPNELGFAYFISANCVDPNSPREGTMMDDGTGFGFGIESTVKPKDISSDLLRLVISFDPFTIAGSNAYSSQDQEIQFCLSVSQTVSAESVGLIAVPFIDPDLRPTLSPTASLEPTNEACGNVGTCTINPDPHFNIWDPNVWYDFQGGW